MHHIESNYPVYPRTWTLMIHTNSSYKLDSYVLLYLVDKYVGLKFLFLTVCGLKGRKLSIIITTKLNSIHLLRLKLYGRDD